MAKKATTLIGVAALSAGALLVSGCSAGGGTSGNTNGDDITLTVQTFTDFGYEGLVAEYEEANPGVKIELTQASQDDQMTQIPTQLASGRGAPDVIGINAEKIATFAKYGDKFVDFNDYGAAEIKDNWVPWTFEGGQFDGKVLGYRTDTGGLSICYNIDALAAAGLPTDREAVSALWPTWADYIKTGKQFTAKNTGVSWTDNAQDIYQTRLHQLDEPLLTQGGKLNTDAENRAAFDDAAAVAEAGLTAKLAPFSADLQAGLQQGKIATSFCPPWYSGLLAGWAGDANKGKWDIASIPTGKGNWGGSYLLVPTQSKNAEAAAKLAAWLTAPEQQEKTFASNTIFPGTVEALESDDVTSATSDFFNSAPIGQIFGDAVTETTGQYFGDGYGTVEGSFISAINRVEQGLQTPDEAWDQAVEEAQDFLDQQ